MWVESCGDMQGGINFRPFRLIERNTISLPGAEFSVVLLRFALPRGRDSTEWPTLGLSQPTTHVKVRLPGAWIRARTFSIVSPADSPGYFSIAVKVHPDGRLSPWLASTPLGTPVYIAHTLTKRLAVPLTLPGRSLIAVSFGIGVAELVVTVRRAVESGQHVAVAAAFRYSADVVFLSELCNIVQSSRASPSMGSLTLHVLLSREEPSDALRSVVLSICSAPGAAARVELRRDRVTTASLRLLLEGSGSQFDRLSAASLAVGSKGQARETYALLNLLGIRQRLLGRPILWGCW